MNSREILISLAMKYSGDWNAISEAIETKQFPDEKEAKDLISKVESQCLTYLDDEYPESLKRVYKPPFVLFYYGDISLISDKNNKIAVVGSRDYSDYGKEVTTKLVSEIAKDFVVISGLAIGIDSIAQRTAIESGGKTVGVLGNGVSFHYIKENQELYEECRNNHLVISEYPNSTPPNTKNFPIRNRIIAGLCDTLLVTEGKIHSGTQITAFLMANKDGNVCCVPTKIGEDSICNYLISEGAFLVETSQDIYDITKVVSKKAIFEK